MDPTDASTVNIGPVIGDIDPVIGDIGPVIGDIDPVIGDIGPVVGEIDSVVGDTDPVVGDISGDIVRLCRDTLSVAEACDAVSRPDCGAIATFCGTTRNYCCASGRSVLRLQYEAYEKMALVEMRRVCTELRRQHSDIERVAIYHRLGDVDVGETSVVIAVSSRHRSGALQAVSAAIDAVKARLPVWKREVYTDGQTCWKRNSECFWLQSTPAV